jgi:hypothetical protein
MRAHWIAALTALALVGCRGSDEPLTHDEFVAQADDNCAGYSGTFEEAIGGLTPESTDDDRNSALEKYARAYEDMADELTELEPPASDRAIAGYLDRVKRNARGFKEDAEKGVLMSDASGDRVYNSLQEERALAQEVGLDECRTLHD